MTKSRATDVALPFAIFTAIWGSTWIVIRDQLGVVPPQWSVAYRFVIAAVAMALVAYGVWRGLDSVLGRSFPAQLASLFGGVAAGLLVYLVSCRLLGVRELNALLSLLPRRRRH